MSISSYIVYSTKETGNINNHVTFVYSDQLVGACSNTQKLVEILFWLFFSLYSCFQMFFRVFRQEITENRLK